MQSEKRERINIPYRILEESFGRIRRGWEKENVVLGGAEFAI